MDPRDFFVDLHRHMEWADAAVWGLVLGSDAACADPGLRERLHHVHLVQRTFLSVWRGEPIDRHAGEGLDLPALATWARAYYPQAQAHIATLSDAAFTAPVNLSWSRFVAERLGFEPAPTALRDTVLQVYAHTAHHRAQILTALRALGTTPPTVDYIMWVWEGRPEPGWPAPGR